MFLALNGHFKVKRRLSVKYDIFYLWCELPLVFASVYFIRSVLKLNIKMFKALFVRVLSRSTNKQLKVKYFSLLHLLVM